MGILALMVGTVQAAHIAAGATIVIYVDPMTLERQVVVYDTKGPDRVLMCPTPAAQSGCVPVNPKR